MRQASVIFTLILLVCRPDVAPGVPVDRQEAASGRRSLPEAVARRHWEAAFGGLGSHQGRSIIISLNRGADFEPEGTDEDPSYPPVITVIDEPPSDSVAPPSTGRRPPPPINISVTQKRTGLLINWLPPNDATSGDPIADTAAPPIRSYVIQYRTVGQWVDLTHSVPAERTWYEWKTASRGATYHFRVLSFDGEAYSEPSPHVTFRTADYQ